MSDWWAYRPHDLLMFSPETYDRLFALVNADVWPAQVATLGAGLAILALILWRPAWAGRAIAALLAAAWAFVAWAYFLERYATINLAAPYFGWGFVTQSLLLAVSGALLGRLAFDRPSSAARKVGLAIVASALLLQPLIGPLAGRPWSGAELFGLAPDPTVLATLGVLLASDRVRWELLPMPLLWCAITGATLWIMGSPEAALMPAMGLLVLVASVYRGLSGHR